MEELSGLIEMLKMGNWAYELTTDARKWRKPIVQEDSTDNEIMSLHLSTKYKHGCALIHLMSNDACDVKWLVVRTVVGPLQTNENLMISNSKLSSDSELLW